MVFHARVKQTRTGVCVVLRLEPAPGREPVFVGKLSFPAKLWDTMRTKLERVLPLAGWRVVIDP
jgi:hypothetical protein